VHNHFILRIDDDLPKRIERPGHERINQVKRVLGRYLDKAQVRMIAVFADELRVESEAAAMCQMGDTFGQFVGLGDDRERAQASHEAGARLAIRSRDPPKRGERPNNG
jgi:hypothetical protein